MSPEQKRKFNTTFGLSFLVLGLIAWGGALVMIYKPNDPFIFKASSADSSTMSSAESKEHSKQCLSTLVKLGYPSASLSSNSKVVTIEDPLKSSVAEVKLQIQQASSAISACSGELSYFCMGSACKNPSSMTMLINIP